MSEWTLIRVTATDIGIGVIQDNGGKTCWFQNDMIFIKGVTDMKCIPGYSASFDGNGNVVNYKYGSFSGQFGTNNPRPGIYDATVWGCS